MPEIAVIPIEAAARDPARPVDYLEFMPASRAPPPPPAFIFGTLPAYLAPELFSDFEIPAAGCYFLRDAAVTYDAIILLQGQPLWSLALNHPHYYVPEALARNVPNLFSLPVRRIPGQAAILHGPGFNIFGHWLVDFLPRLYALRRAGLDIETLSFILPHRIGAFALEFLRLIGIPAGHLILHDHTAECLQPDELVAPTLLRQRNRFSPLLPAATRFWVERLRTNAGLPDLPAQPRKLFVSRAHQPGNRTLKSRAAVESRAAGAGYDIVYPERLPLPAQIQLFRGVTHIIGEYGSALHNAIHAPAGAAICALRGASHHPGFAQSGLAERFQHDLGYVFGDTPRWAQDQEMDIEPDAFARALAAMEERKSLLF